MNALFRKANNSIDTAHKYFQKGAPGVALLRKAGKTLSTLAPVASLVAGAVPMTAAYAPAIGAGLSSFGNKLLNTSRALKNSPLEKKPTVGDTAATIFENMR